MFETLEVRFERSKKPLHRGWPLFTYSIYVVGGLLYMIEGVRRHHPLGVVVGTAVFVLSLIWLITTMKSPVPLSRRDFWIRGQTLVLILLAYEMAYTVAAR